MATLDNIKTASIKIIVQYAASVKASIGGVTKPTPIPEHERRNLIEIFRLLHPMATETNDWHLYAKETRICVAPKPVGYGAFGTSNTCYYISVGKTAPFVAIQFKDIRATVRADRLAVGTTISIGTFEYAGEA